MSKVLCPDHGMTPYPGCCGPDIVFENPWGVDKNMWGSVHPPRTPIVPPTSPANIPPDMSFPITQEDWDSILGDKE